MGWGWTKNGGKERQWVTYWQDKRWSPPNGKGENGIKKVSSRWCVWYLNNTCTRRGKEDNGRSPWRWVFAQMSFFVRQRCDIGHKEEQGGGMMTGQKKGHTPTRTTEWWCSSGEKSASFEGSTWLGHGPRGVDVGKCHLGLSKWNIGMWGQKEINTASSICVVVVVVIIIINITLLLSCCCGGVTLS